MKTPKDFQLQPYNNSVKAKKAAAKWTLRLKEMYADKGGNRAYHNIKHVYEMARMLGCTRACSHLAILDDYIAWFHDCVYDTARPDSDNVHSSSGIAMVALNEMQLPPSDVLYVRAGIMASINHEPTKAYAHITDADLAVLSWEWNTYLEYVAAIRKEYSQYSDKNFILGRKQFLEKFLARPKIFQLAENLALFEQPARENLQKELNTINENPRRYLRWLV